MSSLNRTIKVLPQLTPTPKFTTYALFRFFLSTDQMSRWKNKFSFLSV